MRQYDGRLWVLGKVVAMIGVVVMDPVHMYGIMLKTTPIFSGYGKKSAPYRVCESQSAEGHQTFRTVLPIQAASHDFHAAA